MRVNLSAVCAGTCAVALLLGLAGCSISSNKNNGNDNVKIATPFGGLHVQSNQTTASDVGLPVYPGATVFKDKDNDSANVQMNFGNFHLKVLAASYQSADSADKIFAFYRTALAQYGEVLECKDDHPVGQPAVASSGLTCSDNDHGKHGAVVQMNGLNHDGRQLRAGSPHSFRLVEVDNNGGTNKIELVYLELPRGGEKDSGTN
jgi:hypothetical protein